MSRISIELERSVVLELICLLNSLDFEEGADRFKRYQSELERQLLEQSTMSDLKLAEAKVDSLLDEYHFPEIIE